MFPYSEYDYEFYKSYFSAASRALTKAQAKGLATPFLSQNTGGWSFGTDGFVKKTNWNLWREERRTCDLPNDYLVEYAVKGRPRCQIHSDWFLSSKFQSTINDSQLSILWCLFPREQQRDIGQLQSVGQSGCSKKTNQPFLQFGNPGLVRIGLNWSELVWSSLCLFSEV